MTNKVKDVVLGSLFDNIMDVAGTHARIETSKPHSLFGHTAKVKVHSGGKDIATLRKELVTTLRANGFTGQNTLVQNGETHRHIVMIDDLDKDTNGERYFRVSVDVEELA